MLGRYFILATVPINALALFNVYRRALHVKLSPIAVEIATLFENSIHTIVSAPATTFLGFRPPTILSDLWVISLWVTGVTSIATVGAMRDNSQPPSWRSQLLMLPITLFLGYSFIGFFWGSLTIPLAFAKPNTGDADLDQYARWIRIAVSTCIILVTALFVLNYLSSEITEGEQ